MRLNRFALAVSLCLPVLATAQTVTVNGVTNTPPTAYSTIAAALTSFHTGGPNNGNTGQPNVINITAFGPFNEVLPMVGPGGGASGLTGQVIDGTEGFTIQGQGITPLILLQPNAASTSSAQGLMILGTVTVNLNNLIIAASPTSSPAGNLIRCNDDTVTLNMTDCVLTALPAASTTYTSIANIPADLLDGSRLYDASLTRTGDNGMFLNRVNATFNHAVITNQGAGATPDGIVASTGANVTFEEGCVLSSNRRIGIQVSAGLTTIVRGTAAERVIFANNGLTQQSVDASGIFMGGTGQTLNVDYAIFDSQFRAGIQVNGTSASFDIDETIIANCTQDGLSIGTAGTPTYGTFSNITIADCASNELVVANGTLSVVDSVIAGPGTAGVNAVASTITLTNSGLLNSSFVTPTVGTVNLTGVTADSPLFLATTMAAPSPAGFGGVYPDQDQSVSDYFLTQNPSFQGAATGGQDLRGGARFEEIVFTAAELWECYR